MKNRRGGINLIKLRGVYKKIWELAFPHQDKREDRGHAEITLSFVQQLLGYEKANPNIVIPSIILHDIGWSRMPRDEIAYKLNITPEEDRKRRLNHQEEGANLGRKILNQVGYNKDLSEHILKIVSGHDTETGIFSVEGSVVRDADKLWRFSKIGFRTAIRNLKIPPQREYAKLEKQINEKGFFFTKPARKIARKELKQRNKEF